MASVEDAVSKAQETGVRIDNTGVSVQTRGNLNIRVHRDDIMQACGRVGTENQKLYKGSRANPANESFSLTFDGTSSVQFNMVDDLNRWDEETKAMELATNLRGAAQTVLSDLRPEQRTDYQQLVCVLNQPIKPSYTGPK